MGRLLCSSLGLLLATAVDIKHVQRKKRGRFCYECAGCPVGSILGVSSTKTRQTGPTIEIQGGISPSCLLTNTPTHIYTPRSFTHRLGGYQVI
uniref:RHD domain-containing protein n=1 Tax=Astatotilapia calliptera TaxID=8154 RepID=A0A3P8Q2E8_ASTCA